MAAHKAELEARLAAAEAKLNLIRMRNDIDMLTADENEFELGIRHSATFIQEILDNEMTVDEQDDLRAIHSAAVGG